MTDLEPLKQQGGIENEIHDLAEFIDLGRSVVVGVAEFPAAIALGIVETLARVVRDGHSDPRNFAPDADGVVKAQRFEEGDVLMLAAPYSGFAADRYLMDFYDVTDQDICSRMHFHTGMRFVRIMTGPDTRVLISTLTPARIMRGQQLIEFQTYADRLSLDGVERKRHNIVVPSNTWVDMQIPRGTAHQFNANGPNAVIDTVHPEESIEVLREEIGKISMMAQTIFLQDERPPAEACTIDDESAVSIAQG